MRRVVVTGLGAVTPLGNSAPETWRAALAGESGIDWIDAFDATDYPVRVAAEVKDFDPTSVASPKEQRKLDRNVLLALAAGKEAVEDAGLNGFDPNRVGIAFDGGRIASRICPASTSSWSSNRPLPDSLAHRSGLAFVA